LTVYLRLNEAAVPAIYGPSADERIWLGVLSGNWGRTDPKSVIAMTLDIGMGRV